MSRVVGLLSESSSVMLAEEKTGNGEVTSSARCSDVGLSLSAKGSDSL